MQATCRTLAAILHLGNVEFEGDEASRVSAKGEDALNIAAKLLVVEAEELAQVLTSKRLDIGASAVMKELNPKEVCVRTITSLLRGQWVDKLRNCVAQAKHTRNALAKYIYGKMFEWIVVRTNNFLGDGFMGAAKESSVGSPMPCITCVTAELLRCGTDTAVFPLQVSWISSGSRRSRRKRIPSSSCASTSRTRRCRRSSTSTSSHWSSRCIATRASCGTTSTLWITARVWRCWRARLHPGYCCSSIRYGCRFTKLLYRSRPHSHGDCYWQECLMPKGTDESFARKLYDNLSKNTRFQASARDRVRCTVKWQNHIDPLQPLSVLRLLFSELVQILHRPLRWRGHIRQQGLLRQEQRRHQPRCRSFGGPNYRSCAVRVLQAGSGSGADCSKGTCRCIGNDGGDAIPSAAEGVDGAHQLDDTSLHPLHQTQRNRRARCVGQGHGN